MSICLGSTKTTDDNDLTARTLVKYAIFIPLLQLFTYLLLYSDVVELVGCLFDREQAPPIIIMGHRY